MSLYDIAKTQKLMAENKTDKEIADRLFDLCKHVVKELAENFQIIDNAFKNLVDEMVEFNMPYKPNPFQNWHEVELKIERNDDYEMFKNSSSPKIAQKYLKALTKPAKGTNMMKSSMMYRKFVKNLTSKIAKKVKFGGKSKGPVRVINESLIKKAIEETDCNLNLSKEKPQKKVQLDNVTILTYVAKCFALLGKKVKVSMNKHKKNTNLFAPIMPISMKPKLIIENLEINNSKKRFKSRVRRKMATKFL